MSNWFASKWFAGKYYEEWFGGVRVPVPTYGAGAAALAKSGGFNNLVRMDFVGGLKASCVASTKYVGVDAVKRAIDKCVTQKPYVDPLTPKKLDQEKVKRSELKALRKRARELNEEIEGLKERLHEQEDLREEIGKLRAQVDDLVEQIHQTRVELAGIRSDADRYLSGFIFMAGATAVGLLSALAIPESHKEIRWIGYSSSIAMAMVGLMAVLAPAAPAADEASA